jgi:hypothetical protein
MTEQTNAPAEGEPPPEGPPVPWLDPTVQQAIQWRDGDIVVSVPVKSGTTWMMNIVHQLREGGDADLRDIYVEVPWLELRPSPEISHEDLVSRVDAMPGHRRRAFKTHSAPDVLPFHEAGSGKDVQYVVVARSPDEVLASMWPFISAHSEEWFRLWGVERSEFLPPDFKTFYEVFGRDVAVGSVYDFMESWWPLRNEPNVLMLHFSDMKKDHEGSVRKVADFLGYEPSSEQWQVILECTSFPWMKKNEDRFEARGVGSVQILDPGAMVRKGKVGASHEDGVTPEISEEVSRMGSERVSDKAALDWVFKGGALP